MRFFEYLFRFFVYCFFVVWFLTPQLLYLWVVEDGKMETILTTPNLNEILCDLLGCCEGHTYSYYRLVPNMKKLFHDKIHGQVMATEEIVRVIEHQYKNIDKGQPITIELYGPPGTGKSYTTELMAESIFTRGIESPLLHVLNGEDMYFSEEQLMVYKDYLKSWLVGNLTECRRNMYIFKHREKIPDKLLHVIDEVVTSKMGGIFIFTTTERDSVAANFFFELKKLSVMKKYKNSIWFEPLLKDSSYDIGGRVIFLPMGGEALKNCMNDEIGRLGHFSPPKCMTEKVEKMFTSYHLGYSKITCKDVLEMTREVVEENESC